MSFTVGDVYTDLTDYLSGRPVPTAKGYGWIRKSVLELTETYKLPNVGVPGPLVQLEEFNPGPYDYVAFAPDQPYFSYVRYRKMQSFSEPVASTDVILMPDTWQDIVGYAAAERG